MTTNNDEQSKRPSAVRGTVTSTGISLGGALAVSISWSVNHSLLWALLHGFFGWFYVATYAFGIADQWQPPVQEGASP